jgi:hypothetical protein
MSTTDTKMRSGQNKEFLNVVAGGAKVSNKIEIFK